MIEADPVLCSHYTSGLTVAVRDNTSTLLLPVQSDMTTMHTMKFEQIT